jgi:hypothetical protein
MKPICWWCLLTAAVLALAYLASREPEPDLFGCKWRVE